LDVVLEALARDLQHAIAQTAEGCLFVHAGAVAWNGRAVVIPGASGSGKSTLVHALLNAGAQYLSDEYAAIDSRRLVHAFARPLQLRASSRGSQRTISTSDLPVSASPLPLGALVVTRYRDGAAWQPRTLTHGEAALGVVANTLRARELPGATLQTAAIATARAPCLASDRGDVAVSLPGLVATLTQCLGNP
jgi:hypothetical protein